MKQLFLLLFLPFSTFSQHFGTTTLEVKTLPITPIRLVIIENFIDSFPSARQLSNTQKDWFYWTNYSRSSPKRFWDSVVFPLLDIYPSLRNANAASLQEDLYKSESLPLLLPNLNLTKTANTQAIDLAKSKKKISHTSSSGETFQQRMQTAGIRTCAGENISMGSNNPLLMLVLLYLDEGVQGLGHRKALLNPAFAEMGIGIAMKGDNTVIVVQDFACKQ